ERDRGPLSYAGQVSRSPPSLSRCVKVRSWFGRGIVDGRSPRRCLPTSRRAPDPPCRASTAHASGWGRISKSRRVRRSTCRCWSTARTDANFYTEVMHGDAPSSGPHALFGATYERAREMRARAVEAGKAAAETRQRVAENRGNAASIRARAADQRRRDAEDRQ